MGRCRIAGGDALEGKGCGERGRTVWAKDKNVNGRRARGVWGRERRRRHAAGVVKTLSFFYSLCKPEILSL